MKTGSSSKGCASLSWCSHTFILTYIIAGITFNLALYLHVYHSISFEDKYWHLEIVKVSVYEVVCLNQLYLL
jgi:hypothetical protein